MLDHLFSNVNMLIYPYNSVYANMQCISHPTMYLQRYMPELDKDAPYDSPFHLDVYIHKPVSFQIFTIFT